MATYRTGYHPGQDNVLVAVFGRDDVTNQTVFNGLLGLTDNSISFDDVSAIRRSCGEWNRHCYRPKILIYLNHWRARASKLIRRLNAPEPELVVQK